MTRDLKLLLIFSFFILTGCVTKTNSIISNDQKSVEKQSAVNTTFKLPLLQAESQKNIQNNDDDCCYSTCPVSNIRTNQLIYHSDYVLSYNANTKYADWVAYKIDKNKISGPTRKRIWRADPKISNDKAMKPSDYKGAFAKCNYDRGHQAPLADFSNSKDWEEVNYLSNITPQKSDLNRGSWQKLESKIRSVANSFNGDIYVITGTYYDGGFVCKLPNVRITNIVPNGYWKIITLVDNKNVYRAFFKFKQDTAKHDSFCKYKISPQNLKELLPYSLNINSDAKNSKKALDMLGCVEKSL